MEGLNQAQDYQTDVVYATIVGPFRIGVIP